MIRHHQQNGFLFRPGSENAGQGQQQQQNRFLDAAS